MLKYNSNTINIANDCFFFKALVLKQLSFFEYNLIALNKIFLIILLLFTTNKSVLAEQNDSSIYHFNYWIDVPITVFGIAYNFYGQEQLRQAPRLSPEQYENLSPSDINAFDRLAAKQDPLFANKAHNLSDIALRTAPVLPFLLGFDKEIRKNALNLTLMYLETQSVNTLIYLASAQNIRRSRPFVYNPKEIKERKSGPKSRDSFYSGHVSVVTASTFFMSKVLLDYHPEYRNKRWLIYSIASLPSIYTGYFRFKAGKHFPSDIIVGYLIGASVGILVPQLHKSKFYQKLNISAMPFHDGIRTSLSYKF